MREWSVRFTGRIERIVIFYFGLSTVVMLYLISTPSRRQGFTDIQNDGMFWFMILVFSPFWLPVVVVTLGRLFKSKIPNSVIVNPNTRELTIYFRRRKVRVIHFDQLSFALSGNNAHFGLGLYHTYVGTRGQIVNNKITEIIGTKFTLSWKRSQVWEIAQMLKDLSVTEIQAENRDLPLWERIISN